MANQRVKIIDEKNGVTRVTELSGVRQGDNLYIERSELGKPGDVISVPEFWVEDSEGAASAQYEQGKNESR